MTTQPLQKESLEALDELYNFVDGLDPDFIIRERISIIKSRIQDTRSRAASSPADEDTVTMPRWVFEMLTKERKYNPYTAKDDEVEVRKIIEPLRREGAP